MSCLRMPIPSAGKFTTYCKQPSRALDIRFITSRLPNTRTSGNLYAYRHTFHPCNALCLPWRDVIFTSAPPCSKTGHTTPRWPKSKYLVFFALHGLIFSEPSSPCYRRSVCSLSSVTLCALLSRLKFSTIFLCLLVPWPSIDIHGKFYGDCPREPPLSGV